jgi:hypothetical protein
MKTNDFIVEHTDQHHEDRDVEMAVGDCYNAAKYAMELHDLLKNQSQLEGWVSEKITLANDYLRTVHEYLTAEAAEHEPTVPEFDTFGAEKALDRMLEDGTAGGTGAASVATSMGGGAGFGKSIFMSRNPVKKAKKK